MFTTAAGTAVPSPNPATYKTLRTALRLHVRGEPVETKILRRPEAVSSLPFSRFWNCSFRSKEGSVLAFAATGHGPFDAPSVPAIIYRIATEPPDLGSLTGPLRDVISTGLVP